jgi:hypothetical protein
MQKKPSHTSFRGKSTCAATACTAVLLETGEHSGESSRRGGAHPSSSRSTSSTANTSTSHQSTHRGG